ncbi:MAG: 4Fe-4S dicluster domain-containing protein [Promethearchaeota archaeon]|nr:MAG: 4Fe-4S dicluster domain-containing protein [Candidatus Lokiarchaeota archaeon]
MQIYHLRINHNLCTGCNVCVVSCPINFDHLKEEGQLTKKNAVILVKNGIARPIYNEEREFNCDGCGVCLEACPQVAIKLEILNAAEE